MSPCDIGVDKSTEKVVVARLERLEDFDLHAVGKANLTGTKPRVDTKGNEIAAEISGVSGPKFLRGLGGYRYVVKIKLHVSLWSLWSPADKASEII